jgi:hypothetical protein
MNKVRKRSNVSRDIAGCIATGYGLDGREVGVRVPVRARFLFSPWFADQVLGSLSDRYQGLLPGVKAPRCVKLTTRHHLVPRSIIRGSIHPLPHTSSWRSGSLVRHRDSFAFALLECYPSHPPRLFMQVVLWYYVATDVSVSEGCLLFRFTWRVWHRKVAALKLNRRN